SRPSLERSAPAATARTLPGATSNHRDTNLKGLMSTSRPNSSEPRRKKSSNVPGQALGYSLQFTRMAAMLFEAGPGTLVSFEVFDDVGEEAGDGTQTFVQTKSALRGNPLADRSVELWKTLANWSEAIRGRQHD